MLLTHRINFVQISFITNFVYVCQTSNHLGTISLFTRSFLGKPLNVRVNKLVVPLRLSDFLT